MGKYNGKIDEYPLGERIRYLRKERGFTQEEFSKKLGITQGALSQIEKGQYNITVQMLIKIATELKVHPAIMFAGDRVFVFDIKSLAKYQKATDLPPSLRRSTIGILRLFRKWGLK